MSSGFIWKHLEVGYFKTCESDTWDALCVATLQRCCMLESFTAAVREFV